MNCLNARETLESAALGDFDAATVDQAARHIEECASCQAAVRRQEQRDARIGQFCRDVPVPPGLKERVLARLEAGAEENARTAIAATAEAGIPDRSPSATPPSARPFVRPPAMSRRKWLAIASTTAALALVGTLGLVYLRASSHALNLDEVAGLVADHSLDPEQLDLFTQFGNGLAIRLPATIITRPLVDPPRKIEGCDGAVYFFQLPGRRGAAPLQGRLVVMPLDWIKDKESLRSVTSFLAGPTPYKNGFCTTAWAEGNLAYVCCLSAGENELHRLMPPRPVAV